MVAVDWITKLPLSQGYDLILTVTDHDCTKAVIFIPCRENMEIEEMTQLYIQNVAVHYSLPSKVISDRDLRLTSELFKALCKAFQVQQNTSTAYHQQTDGQSE